VTIREFARLVLPIYRRERWRWSTNSRRVMRVPTELEIARTIRRMVFHRRVLRQGFTSRSGGLIVKRCSAKTLIVAMMPRRYFRPSRYAQDPFFDPVFHPVVKEVVTL
jgi:hypothetical protein